MSLVGSAVSYRLPIQSPIRLVEAGRDASAPSHIHVSPNVPWKGLVPSSSRTGRGAAAVELELDGRLDTVSGTRPRERLVNLQLRFLVSGERRWGGSFARVLGLLFIGLPILVLVLL